VQQNCEPLGRPFADGFIKEGAYVREGRP